MTSIKFISPDIRGIVVGEAPGPGQKAHDVLTGPSGERLSKLLGRDWRRVLVGVNLLGPQRLSSGGSEFDAGSARVAARVLAMSSPWFTPGGRAVLLGKRVARAFGVSTSCRRPAYVARMRWTVNGEEKWFMDALVVPHPSGRCRTWNDRRAAGQVSRALREYLCL